MKIIAWNILNGFHNLYSIQFEPERLALAKSFLQNHQPDIFIINEATFGNESNGRYIDYQKEFSQFDFYSYFVEREDWGIAVLSKYPIQVSKNILVDRDLKRKFDYFAGRVKIKGIWIDTCHPRPIWPEKKKLECFKYLLDSRLDPYVIIGDFNLVSHRDKNPFKQTSLVIPCMENEYNLIDAFENDRDFTHPTPEYEKKFEKLPQVNAPRVKIDHCFVSKSITIKNARIMKNDVRIDKISDHYPLEVEVEITT